MLGISLRLVAGSPTVDGHEISAGMLGTVAGHGTSRDRVFFPCGSPHGDGVEDQVWLGYLNSGAAFN